MTVEDYVSSDEEIHYESAQDAMERMTASRTSKAAFAVNKHNREALIDLQKKMMELQDYLERNGLSMADFEWDTMLKNFDFNHGVQDSMKAALGRDEFRLHTFVGNRNGMSLSKEEFAVDNSGKNSKLEIGAAFVKTMFNDV